MTNRTQRSRSAVFTTTLLLAFSLTGCGGGEGGGSSTQSAAAVSPSTQSTGAVSDTPLPQQPAPGSDQQAVGSATVQWAAPQQKTDGSALQNLAGFTIVYGTTENNLDQSIRVDNPSIDTYIVEELPAGTYYFAVKAHDVNGAESELSNVMTKAIG